MRATPGAAVLALVLAGVLAAGCAGTGDLPNMPGGWSRTADGGFQFRGRRYAEGELLALAVEPRAAWSERDRADVLRMLASYAGDRDHQAVALLALARLHERQGATADAVRDYREFLRRFPSAPDHRAVLRRALDLALAMAQDGESSAVLGVPIGRSFSEGVELLRDLLERHPFEDFSDDYAFRLARILYERKEIDEARLEFDFLMTTYPKGEWSSHALFYLGMCDRASYGGPSYEASALHAARKRFIRYGELYPDGPLREEADRALAEVESLLAERIYQTASFYRRRDRLSATRLYLRQIVKEFPRTEWADRAQAELVDLGPEPPPTPETPDEGGGQASMSR